MSFFTHCQDEQDNLFTCKSSFVPFVSPEEQPSLSEEKPKKDEVKYLPGERLLIKLGKKKKKERKDNIDVGRISASLTRVLSSF